MIEAELQQFLAGFTIEPLDPVTDSITTPFSDRNGYPIRILVRKRGSQFYLFNERERIFSREKMTLFLRPDGKARLREILRRFDVYHIEGEISTEATGENLPVRVRNLLHALILLDTLF